MSVGIVSRQLQTLLCKVAAGKTNVDTVVVAVTHGVSEVDVREAKIQAILYRISQIFAKSKFVDVHDAVLMDST